ncbi:hypothetical protein D3C86_1729410 [compost metagenome]
MNYGHRTDAVESESGNVDHVILIDREETLVVVEGVLQPSQLARAFALLLPDLHTRAGPGDKVRHGAGTIADDVCNTIAPQQHLRHQEFPRRRRHPGGAKLLVQRPPISVVHLLTCPAHALKDGKRQLGDRSGDQRYTRIHGRHPHCGLVIDHSAGRCPRITKNLKHADVGR